MTLVLCATLGFIVIGCRSKPDAPSGRTPTFLPASGLVKYGDRVKVEAYCDAHPDCKAVSVETPLACHPPEPCAIEIKSVTGIGEDTPGYIEVRGTATDCETVLVHWKCSGSESSAWVNVGDDRQAPNGWIATFTWPLKPWQIHCGDKIKVDASCAAKPDCKAVTVETALVCKPLARGQNSCAIEIKSVTGIGEDTPGYIEVRGTATDCETVLVHWKCSGSESSARVNVGDDRQAPNGWIATFTWPLEPWQIHCGDKIKVDASCAAKPDCKAVTVETALVCKPLAPDPNPCRIEIKSVAGIGNTGSAPTSITVKGTAVNYYCKTIRVRLTYPGFTTTALAKVGSNPYAPDAWSATFLPTSGPDLK